MVVTQFAPNALSQDNWPVSAPSPGARAGEDGTALREQPAEPWPIYVYAGYQELAPARGRGSRQEHELQQKQMALQFSAALGSHGDCATSIQPGSHDPESLMNSQASTWVASYQSSPQQPNLVAFSPPEMADYDEGRWDQQVASTHMAPAEDSPSSPQPPPRRSTLSSRAGGLAAMHQPPAGFACADHSHAPGLAMEISSPAPPAAAPAPSSPSKSTSGTGSKMPRVLFAGGPRRNSAAEPSATRPSDAWSEDAGAAAMRVSEGSQQVAEDRRSFWLKESVSGIGILLSDCLSGINVVKILPGGLAAKDGTLQVDDVLVSMEGMDVWDQKLTGIVDLLSHVNIRISVVSFEFERQPPPGMEMQLPQRLAVTFTLAGEGLGSQAKVWLGKDGQNRVIL